MHRASAAAVLAALTALLAAGCSIGTGPNRIAAAGGHAARAAASPATRASPSSAGVTPSVGGPAPSARPSPSGPAVLPVAPGAGSKPQTRAFPGTDDAAFRHAMADLWLAVTRGNPDYALPAFFPLTAYEQVKAIANPAADWKNRLWYDFTLDVAAAHRLAGSRATLVRVIVPVQYATWIYPGGCYNSLGYWHVPGVRVVYRTGGQERSFGIASLISWRGVWYVVHFGAVLRPAATGIVDGPAAGPGVPGPPGGC